MNRFKTDSQDKKQKKTSRFKIPFNFEMNTQTRRSLGIIALMVSVFMLLSFISFLGTFHADYGIVHKLKGSHLLSIDKTQQSNWMGFVGAVISHKFIYSWFGIASFVFPAFLTVFALAFAFDFRLKNQKTFIRSGLFLLLWLPIAASLMATGRFDFFAGGYGVYMNLWLRTIIGAPGLVLLLVGSLITYLLLALNYDVVERIMSGKPEGEEEPSVKVKSTPAPKRDEHEEDEQPIEKPARREPLVSDDDNFEIAFEKPADRLSKTEPEQMTGTIDMSDDDSDIDDTPFEESDSDLEIERAERKDERVERIDHSTEDYDPTLDLSNYRYPGLDLLTEYEQPEQTITKADLEARKNLIVETLANYKIDIAKVKATIGPTVTLFEIVPAPGVRISKIKNLEDDIALSLAALGIRIIAPIPGKGTVGIEVPNVKPETVSMLDVISSSTFQKADMELPIAFGRTIQNDVFVTDLTKMPHLLMAGATGQGKSVGLNVIIASILFKKHPSQVKFVMVDPKKVELSLYKIIEQHFLAKLPDEEESIITDTSKVVNTLNSLCIEMDQRYDLLKEAQVRNIKEYNHKFLKRRLNPEKGHRYIPYIVLIIDELADLMMTAGKEVETPIARLAQLARAIGIHLVVATQRPSVNIITGIIKANFPARLAFRVTSKVDSRTILDTGGADQLIGRGDMLFTTGGDVQRVQCAFVDTPEVEDVCKFIGDQHGYPTAFLLPEAPSESGSSDTSSLANDDLDPLFDDAARTIIQNQMGSTSLLQRRLKLGYNRAGRLIDQLERAGIVGPHEGSKAREVLYPDEYSLEQFLNEFHGNRK